MTTRYLAARKINGSYHYLTRTTPDIVTAQMNPDDPIPENGLRYPSKGAALSAATEVPGIGITVAISDDPRPAGRSGRRRFSDT